MSNFRRFTLISQWVDERVRGYYETIAQPQLKERERLEVIEAEAYDYIYKLYTSSRGRITVLTNKIINRERELIATLEEAEKLVKAMRAAQVSCVDDTVRSTWGILTKGIAEYEQFKKDNLRPRGT